jgi:hypothetical protein
MNSFTYGVNNLKRIAGVAGHSAPFGPPALLDAATTAKTSGQYLPMYAIAGNRDMYKPLPVNQTPRSFYNVIRAFALLNDITVPDGPDLAVNDIFGLRLDGPGWSQLAGRRALVGTLSNSKGAMIKLVALDPYGHWNFKPAAEDMWAFLSRFRRDVTSGALQVDAGAGDTMDGPARWNRTSLRMFGINNLQSRLTMKNTNCVRPHNRSHSLTGDSRIRYFPEQRDPS